MKVRHGFVSNSSASSFVVDWECLNMVRGDSLTDLLIRLFDCYAEKKKDGEGNVTYDWTYHEHEKKIIDGVEEKTLPVKGSKKRFRTIFHTSMRNTVADYGETCGMFVMALSVDSIENNNFKVIQTQVIDDS